MQSQSKNSFLSTSLETLGDGLTMLLWMSQASSNLPQRGGEAEGAENEFNLCHLCSFAPLRQTERRHAHHAGNELWGITALSVFKEIMGFDDGGLRTARPTCAGQAQAQRG